MSNKQGYRKLSSEQPSIPIFSRDWWLDAVCGEDGWDVVTVEKGGEIIAAMPYAMKSRFGLRVLGQPLLTQKLGPWFLPTAKDDRQRIENEMEVMGELIDGLPDFDHFNQNWHYRYNNWLPFYWRGFSQTTRYTYVLTDIQDTEKCWKTFHGSARRTCKKATERYKLEVRDDFPLDTLLSLNAMTFARQGLPVPFPDELMHRIDAACTARGCRKLLVAVDPEGRCHAADYLVWDENSAYGIVNGSDPALRSSGAVSLCIWEGIKHAARVTKSFDFTGSMIEPVEGFFRSFGATQVAYFNVSKSPSRVVRLHQGLAALIGT